jgi:hypothetical protein
MTFLRLVFLVFAVTLTFIPLVVVCEETSDDSAPEENPVSKGVVPLEVGRLYAYGNIGVSPPIIDMDAYRGGAISLNLGMDRVMLGRAFLGFSARYQPTMIVTDSDLYIHFIGAHVRGGFFIANGFQIYVGLGITIVGDMAYGNSHHSPYFSAEYGVSYTFWFGKVPTNGLEFGLEMDTMFGSDFEETGWESGVKTDNVFAYVMLFLGYRFSWNPCK